VEARNHTDQITRAHNTTELVEKQRREARRIELTTEGLPGRGVLRGGAAQRQQEQEQEQGRAEKGPCAAAPPHCRPPPVPTETVAPSPAETEQGSRGRGGEEARR
jgi:hypothetical protein